MPIRLMQVRCFRCSRWDRVAPSQKRHALMIRSPPTQTSATLLLSTWRLSAVGVSDSVCQLLGFNLRFLHSISWRSGFGAWIAVRLLFMSTSYADIDCPKCLAFGRHTRSIPLRMINQSLIAIISWEADSCRRLIRCTILDQLIFHPLMFIIHVDIGKPAIEQASAWHDFASRQHNMCISYYSANVFLNACGSSFMIVQIDHLSCTNTHAHLGVHDFEV